MPITTTPADALAEAIERYLPDQTQRERARSLSVSEGYLSHLLSGEYPFTARLVRRWRIEHPTLRPWCDALLLSDNGHRVTGSPADSPEKDEVVAV